MTPGDIFHQLQLHLLQYLAMGVLARMSLLFLKPQRDSSSLDGTAP